MEDVELELVIAACRAGYGGEPVQLEDSSNIRWNRFARLAERHRVQALCWHGLGEAQRLVPPQIASSLSKFASETAARSMQMAAECGRLRGPFDAEGLELLFVKGATLGAIAYPNPFLKMSVDIDLLVAPEQLREAVSALGSAGYRPTVPGNSDDGGIERWHRTHKESVWRRAETGFQLDLHTRLADQPALIPALGVNSPRQSVVVAPGIELPTLARDELFAYLCVHGASSAWFRLKWLCDLAALLHGETPDEIKRLHDRSLQLGAGRAAAQAILLAETIFGIGLPASLRDRLRADPFNRWLTRIALDQLTLEREPLDRRLGTMSIHLSQLFLLPGVTYLASELGRQARSILGRAAQ